MQKHNLQYYKNMETRSYATFPEAFRAGDTCRQFQNELPSFLNKSIKKGNFLYKQFQISYVSQEVGTFSQEPVIQNLNMKCLPTPDIFLYLQIQKLSTINKNIIFFQ